MRTRAIAEHDGAELPPRALHAVAEQIRACCGHSPLKSLRLAAGWTVTQAVAELARTARAADLPERGIDARTWRRWESQYVRPDDDYQDRLARLFATDPVRLGFANDYTHQQGGSTNRRDALRTLGAAALVAPTLGRASDAERIARELTRISETTDVGPSTLDGLRQVIADYGHQYARYPAGDLWQAALTDRHRVAELLQLRTTLRQRRELYIAAAWLSVILAWSAHDQGDNRAALAYAADARHHADQADHDELNAWAHDIAATVWFYSGRPDEALRAAERGASAAPVGTSARVRLTGQLARVHARLGHADAATETLQVLLKQAEQEPVHAAGLFTSDTARVLSISATAYLSLDQHEQARRTAQEAVSVYQQAPPGSSPTRQAITRIDLAIACARLGDPDRSVTEGLTALTATRYAAAIVTRAKDLQKMLESDYPSAAVVGNLKRGLAELHTAQH
ncbi:hypothetical protein AAH991_39020 [Microbispora sp. ZYX-F-249]|uniref:XRE family transcriptional regulator n=1 Tax=Microbispora maris TaxID=3144104 RepID=A0ABV0B0V8_9ACTN